MFCRPWWCSVDGGGVLQAEVQALSNLQIRTMRDAFLLFDKDGDGAISTDEITALMCSMGYDKGSKDVEDMIKPFDTDGEATSFDML